MVHSSKYVSLDLVRGIAALLVCAGHLRNFLYVDFNEVVNPNLTDRLFYFVTGLGHQAVIVFFVLSGYFVGGSVWKQVNNRAFSWGKYGVVRLTRLMMVLVPALLATLVFDRIGTFLRDGSGYDGKWYGLLLSGPGIGADRIDLSLPTFFGNVFFLQTIAVPVFGSNGPLWSLAYEFWYYLLFPLIAIAVHEKSIRSLPAITSLILLFIFLPFAIVSNFLFWALGCIAATSAHKLAGGKKQTLLAILFFLVALAISKMLSGFLSDLIVAIPTMLLLMVFSTLTLKQPLVVRCTTMLSDMSYSVYLFHFPFLAFCWFIFCAPVQFQPTSLNYLVFLSLTFVTLLFCFAMWWLFERHTNRVRQFLERRVLGGRL